ncbi:NnrU family protein [Halioxenophilus sp. WMMB6]|uniref:NnrU family protein n=1 Tax=Halioxenophilus sp. WMMB6 TaxID=3073815 RepID=UPI00295E6C65|nr:NnrU family protein [Halioxenophilus sp. WMMB6]
MLLLVSGLLLWAVIHFVPVLAPHFRQAAIVNIGQPLWRVLFATIVFSALFLIVTGWRSIVPTPVWLPPTWTRHITMLLVPIAIILLSATFLPTDLKRFIRQPQLAGLKLWATAHLLCNGELRSIILFGGFLFWAVLQLIFTKRYAGRSWTEAKPYGWFKTLASSVIGLIVSAVLAFTHVYFTGVPLLP